MLHYLDADHPLNSSLGNTLRIFAARTWATLTANWLNISFALIVVSSTARTISLLVAKKLDPQKEQMIWLGLIIVSLLCVANLHKSMKRGVWHQTLWKEPLGVMLSLMVIYAAIFTGSRRWQAFLWIAIFGLMAWGFQGRTAAPKEAKMAQQYLSHNRAQVCVDNSSAWIETVNQTTDFLQQTLAEDELFFALPYDPLYYYLTHRESPTRQLIFFDHMNIPEELERKIIAELEEKNIQHIIISLRQRSSETGLRIFSQDYCPLIEDYIRANFDQIVLFGDWKNPPGWAWNHGTAIFERR